jgi:polyhydroxyalkanoate synthesis regulator phasin
MMFSNPERMQVLKMLEDGKISLEEATKLLAAVENQRKPEGPERGRGGVIFASPERMQILKMVESGKITADQGATLLSSLAGTRPKTEAGAPSEGPRWLRAKVSDAKTGKVKVNVNIPIGLVTVGLKFGARFVPDMAGMNPDELAEAIKSGAQGKIVDAEDDETGEHIEIFLE